MKTKIEVRLPRKKSKAYAIIQECGKRCDPYRDNKRDAWACKTCDEWLEKGCGDSSCGFCTGRSPRPSDD